MGRFAEAHPKLSVRSKEDYEALAAKLLARRAARGSPANDIRVGTLHAIIKHLEPCLGKDWHKEK